MQLHGVRTSLAVGHAGRRHTVGIEHGVIVKRALRSALAKRVVSTSSWEESTTPWEGTHQSAVPVIEPIAAAAAATSAASAGRSLAFVLALLLSLLLGDLAGIDKLAMLRVLLDVFALELGCVLELGPERGELLLIRLGWLSNRRKLADSGLEAYREYKDRV